MTTTVSSTWNVILYFVALYVCYSQRPKSIGYHAEIACRVLPPVAVFFSKYNASYIIILMTTSMPIERGCAAGKYLSQYTSRRRLNLMPFCQTFGLISVLRSWVGYQESYMHGMLTSVREVGPFAQIVGT